MSLIESSRKPPLLDSRRVQLLEDADSADEEFWNQDFFAEEDRDQEFEASESEEEDVPDTDFSDSVCSSMLTAFASLRSRFLSQTGPLVPKGFC